LLESIYVLAHFFGPFIPFASEKIFQKLGTDPVSFDLLRDDFVNLKEGTAVVSDKILFDEFEIDEA